MKKRILRSLCIVALLICLFPTAYKSKCDQTVLDGEDIYSILWQPGSINYKGQIYQYNSRVKTYLVMGIDKMGPAVYEENEWEGGQADALFLLVVDSDNRKWNIVSINRNTMTQVERVDKYGMYNGMINAQICVQHGFGDGLEESCIRQKNAVTRTLFGLPIDGYVAINMGAIAAINDAIGGVELTTIEEINRQQDGVYIAQDETLKLQGIQAWAYVVYRDEAQLDSASKRLERQKHYIREAYATIRNSDVDKLKLVGDVYNVVQDYMVMDIPAIELAYQILMYDKDLDEIATFPGEEVAGDRFVEYYLDEEKTLEMLINTYYTKVN